MGCEAGGDIWDPVGVMTRYSLADFELDNSLELKAGILKDVPSGSGTSEEGQCVKNTYSYCKPLGELKFSGPESIIGRSVWFNKKEDPGNGAAHDDEPLACGTIGTAIYDVREDYNFYLPSGADDEDGNLC